LARAWLWIFVVGCGGQVVGGVDSGGGDTGSGGDSASGNTCVMNADCPSMAQVCGFAESDACTATGHCFASGPVCNSFSPGCSCAGQTINIACNGLPTGYAPAPLAHTGPCFKSMDGGGAFICGSHVCTPGQEVCYIPANVPNGATCMPSSCTDCTCAQAHFQCLSSCMQTGPDIYVKCQ
jgi:hypothetical protein